jgi:two-component system, chemotaxis family, response regulator Rcp1
LRLTGEVIHAMSSQSAEKYDCGRDVNLSPPAVLLVEDNPADVLLVRKALQERCNKIRLTVAENGQDGLALLMHGMKTPDLVILDLNLPMLDGFGVLAGYRPREAPVVVFSSTRNPDEVEKALALGAYDFVQKPGDLRSFIEAIKRMAGLFIPQC